MTLFLATLAITLVAFLLFAVMIALVGHKKKECNCKTAKRIVANYGKNRVN